MYISDPKQFIDLMLANKKVLVTSDTYGQLQLFDVSLHKKGPREDKFYLKHAFELINVRRGNSVIFDGQQYTFCKRGMIKFYDLDIKYIHQEQGIQQKLSGYQQRIIENIFNTVRDKPVTLHRLFKENGEHCQISFTHGRWIIASKNFTMLEGYEPDGIKAIWPKIIQEQWLKIASDDLKEFCKTHTLIGEYCGNQNYQHITRYPMIEIIFYAIVENNTEVACLPVSGSKEFFIKHGLPFVKCESVECLTYQDTLQQLQEWSLRINHASIDEEGEGSVIYIEHENRNISFCKIKTHEYTIYRDLRELLKICIHKPNQIEMLLNQFSQKAARFVPPKPIQYYIHLAQIAIRELPKFQFEDIRYKFVDFLDYIRTLQIKEAQNMDNIIIKTPTKHTRLLLVCPPMFLNDTNLHDLKQRLRISSIESSFETRKKPAQLEKRALSVISLKPSLPYNIINEGMLDNVLDKSPELNIVYIFIGLHKEGLAQATQNLQNPAFQQLNPQSSALSVQITAGKLKDQLQALELKYNKMVLMRDDIKKNFPNRSFEFEDLNIKGLDEIYTRFEKADATSDAPLEEDQESEEDDIQTEKEIVVIYPIMIPGCGKTTFLEYMHQHYKEYPFESISGDEITDQLIKEKLGPDCKESLAYQFQAVFKDIKNRFNQELYQRMDAIINRQEQKIILFIDRNCVPHTLQSTLEHVKTIKSELQIKYGRVFKVHHLGLLFPQQEPNIPDTPFNQNFIVQILNRLLDRSDHILLGNDAIYKVKVCIKNIVLFNKFTAKKLYKYNIKHQISLNEFKDTAVLKQQDVTRFNNLLLRCIHNSTLTRELGEGEEYQDLLTLFYEYKELYKFNTVDIESECQANCAKVALKINECFKLT